MADKQNKFSVCLWWIREVTALGFWSFIFVEIFVFDLSAALIKRLPPIAQTIFDYRIFIFLGLIALLWVLLGNQRFYRSVVYVLFYPLVVICWRVPKMMFKNWVILLVFSPAIHSLIVSFKASFVLTVIAILAALSILLSSSKNLLISAMAFLAFYLIRHAVKKIRMAFQPSSVFTNIADSIRKIWKFHEEKVLSEQVKAISKIDPNSDAYNQKVLENLNFLYMLNSIFQGIIYKFKKSGVSRKLDIYFISSLLYAAILCVVIFAFEYLGLQKLNTANFGPSIDNNYWEFLGYSFNTLMTASISPIVPKSALAQLATHIELIAALLLLVILVFIILTIFREKFKEDAELAIIELKRSADLLEGHILDQYKMTISDAEAKLLQKYGAGIVNHCRRFRGLEVIEIKTDQKQTTNPPQ